MGDKSLSSSLSYLSSLLCSLGIKPFPSHLLLLAAANDPSAASSVLSLLPDLVAFHLALLHLPNSSTPRSLSTTKDEYKSNVQFDNCSHARDEKLVHQKHHSCGNIIQCPLAGDHLDVMPMPDASSTSQEDKLCFVKFYLALWGYAPSSPLFTLSSGTNQSRHLLLALGWLICHCNIFSRALETRFSGFMGNTPVITNTYLDGLAMERGREAMEEARQYVAKVIAASNSLGECSRLKVKTQGEQLLMMCGHLRMTLRSLYALISCKAKRIHELNQLQLMDNIKGPGGHPFSPFELHLLEQHKTLEKHLMTLEMAKCMIKESQKCNHHETIFWQWMSKVAAEAQQQQHNCTTVDQQLSTSSGVCTTNLLPILTYFRNVLNGKRSAQEPTSEGNANANRVMTMRKDIQERGSQAKSSLCHFRTSNNQNEDSGSQLIGVFASLHRHLLPQDAAPNAQHVQCLDGKLVKSMKEIATMLVSRLAEIRVKNRAIIQDALKVSLANKDNFFAGV